jgi:hypothetical protein
MLAPDDPGLASPAPASRLGFTAKHYGSDWRLMWNREALTRLNAMGAMLAIRDGGVDRLQFLSPQDLAAGAIFYVPRTTDLSFNLKVTVPDGSEIEEQIRVLGADSADELLARPIQPRRIGDAAREEVPDAVPAATGALATATRQFQPPALPAAKTEPAAEIALPRVTLPSADAPQMPRLDLAQSIPAAPAPAAPPHVSEMPNAPPPVITRTEPAARRAVPAAWPRNTARSAVVEVRIRVQIDAAGRVVGATPIQRTVANFPFVDSALTASRLWTFAPAMENGKAVASETVLTFKFTP